MDYVIASDIHGSASACEALLEIVDRERVEKLLLLGDIPVSYTHLTLPTK